MTNQEVFDECVSHVMRQGKPAFSKARDGRIACDYLSKDGRSCAIGGPLVARCLYAKEMEGTTVRALLRRKAKATLGGAALAAALDAWGVSAGQYRLLDRIQAAHDDGVTGADFIPQFKHAVSRIARFYRLNAYLLRSA